MSRKSRRNKKKFSKIKKRISKANKKPRYRKTRRKRGGGEMSKSEGTAFRQQYGDAAFEDEMSRRNKEANKPDADHDKRAKKQEIRRNMVAKKLKLEVLKDIAETHSDPTTREVAKEVAAKAQKPKGRFFGLF